MTEEAANGLGKIHTENLTYVDADQPASRLLLHSCVTRILAKADGLVARIFLASVLGRSQKGQLAVPAATRAPIGVSLSVEEV